MEDVFVGSVMSSPVETVREDTSVVEAASMLSEAGIGSVMVVDGEGRIAGILTATDFVKMVAEGEKRTETLVHEYMTRDVVTTTVQTDIHDVADVMIENHIHHVPVVDHEDGVIGIVTTTDLTAYLSHIQTQSPSE